MSKEEIEVLKTFKSGFGLTSAEQVILANYIEQLEKENAELTKRLEHLCKSDTICSYDEVDIKGNYKKDILTLDKLQKELKDSINARFELQRRIDKLQKENEELKEQNNYYRNDIEILEELLGDDE